MSGTMAYVRIDENGVMRVGETRVMIDSVVAGFQQGLSAETIQQQYPALTLEEVYGAITYYLGHRRLVDAYLLKQQQTWNNLRGQQVEGIGAVIQRLRALRRTETHEAP